MVHRFVAGEDLDSALPAVRDLAGDRLVTLDFLGEDTNDQAQAEATQLTALT